MTQKQGFKNKGHVRNAEAGSALVYILIAIALLAALTVSFMEPSSQQNQSQNTFKTMSDLQSQASFITSTVQECVLSHPGGDITIDNSLTGTDPGAKRRYPINPNSTHLPVALRSGDHLVKNLRCPGNPGDSNNHQAIFGGTTGKFLPPPPPLFEDWKWYNGDDGVFFWTETTKSDAYLQTALAKLDNEYSKCEADVIDARSGAVDMDSDTPDVANCPLGSTCFRVWMSLTASAVHQDAGCP